LRRRDVVDELLIARFEVLQLAFREVLHGHDPLARPLHGGDDLV
jgi:hypothetical protein